MRSRKVLRAAKPSYIAMSIAFCVSGILLMLFPGVSVSVVGVTAGIMLIAFGLVKLMGYFSKDLYQLAFQFDLAFGVLLAVLGVVVLVSPDRALIFLASSWALPFWRMGCLSCNPLWMPGASACESGACC